MLIVIVIVIITIVPRVVRLLHFLCKDLGFIWIHTILYDIIEGPGRIRMPMKSWGQAEVWQFPHLNTGLDGSQYQLTAIYIYIYIYI